MRCSMVFFNFNFFTTANGGKCRYGTVELVKELPVADMPQSKRYYVLIHDIP